MTRQYFQFGHSHFLPHISQFIIKCPVIQHDIIITTDIICLIVVLNSVVFHALKLIPLSPYVLLILELSTGINEYT